MSLIRKFGFLIVILFVADLILVQRKFSASTAFTKQNQNYEPTNLEAGFVLYSADQRRPRIRAAVDNYENETIQNIVIVGGCRPKIAYFGAQDWAEEVKAMGIMPTHVHYGSGSNDTDSNLARIEELAIKNNWNRIAIISDPLHLMRVSKILKENSAPKFMNDFRPIFSSYGSSPFAHVRRAQYEVIVDILQFLTTDKHYNQLLNFLRSGTDDALETSICSVIAPS